MPVMRGAAAQILVELEGALLGDEHGGIAEAVFGRDFDRFRAAGADDVAGGMRTLERPRPRVEEPVRVELAEVRGRTVLGPGLQDDLERLAEPLARRRRVYRVGPVFHS